MAAWGFTQVQTNLQNHTVALPSQKQIWMSWEDHPPRPSRLGSGGKGTKADKILSHSRFFTPFSLVIFGVAGVSQNTTCLLMVKHEIKDMQVEEGNRTKNINITSGKCFHLGYVSAFTVINTQFRKTLIERTLPPVGSPDYPEYKSVKPYCPSNLEDLVYWWWREIRNWELKPQTDGLFRNLQHPRLFSLPKGWNHLVWEHMPQREFGWLE